MAKRELALYYYDSCPYCEKVLRFMHEHNLRIPLKNTLKVPAHRQELIEAGGKSQVPCLFINGNPMYESDDIIKWLRAHKHEIREEMTS